MEHRSLSNSSRKDAKPQRNIEKIASIVIDTCFDLHKNLGPGLLESVYEAVLAKILRSKGLRVERQMIVPIYYQGIIIDEGFRLDLLIEDILIVELKSVETIHPVHPKQVLTYLRLMNLSLGLLINFGAPMLKDGLKRIVNNHSEFSF